MSSIRLRILSDLHFAEPPSRITDIEMIRPLLEVAGRTILNGDSVDTRFVETEPAAAAGRDRFLDFVAGFGDRLTLITGNHDPNISSHHHLELNDGRVLVTHGDVLFPSVAPWGWEAPHVLEARAKRLAELHHHERASFETQLSVSKHASYVTRHLSPAAMREAGGTLARLMRMASRVRRADKILSSWFHAPSLASALAAAHRPKAEVVIIGHTHLPGIWRRRGRWVINTGAFTPPFGATVVDFTDDQIEVRAVARKHGEFRAEEVTRTLVPGRDLSPAFH